MPVLACLRSRSSHEERGLKLYRARDALSGLRRSSHEERGLKWSAYRRQVDGAYVAPRMRSVD